MAENTTVDKLILHDVISLNTYGVGTVNNVSNGVLLGFESGDSLRNPQVAAVNHANIYSSLPNTPTNSTPNDFTKYNYLLIKQVDSSIIEIGIPWINPVSLTRLVRKTVTAVITDFDPADLQKLSDLLVTNGILNVTFTVA